MLGLRLHRIVVVGQIGQHWTLEDGLDGFDASQLIVMQLQHFQLIQILEAGPVGQPGDVVVGEVQSDQVDAFREELKLLVEKLVACQHQDFQFLWRDYLAVEKTVCA